jgi:hypothetical protein
MTDKLSAADGLRAYADFLDSNPQFQVNSEICFYNIGGVAVIQELLASSPEWKITIEQSHDIIYIRRTFGQLVVEHVIARDIMCEPSIVDGKIVWVLKPEFQQVLDNRAATVAA